MWHLQNCCSQRHQSDFPTWLSLALVEEAMNSQRKHSMGWHAHQVLPVVGFLSLS